MQKRKIQLTEIEHMRKLNRFLNEDSAHEKMIKKDPRIKDPTRKHPLRPLGSVKKKDKPTDNSWMKNHKARELFRTEANEPYDHTKRKALHGITQQANQHTKVKVGSKTPKVDMEKALKLRKSNVAKGNRGGGGIHEDDEARSHGGKMTTIKIKSESQYPDWSDGSHQSIDEKAPHRKSFGYRGGLKGDPTNNSWRHNTQKKTADDERSTTSGHSIKPIKLSGGRPDYKYTDDNGKLKSTIIANKKQQARNTLRKASKIKPKLPK